MLLDLLYSEDIDIKDLEKYFLASSQGQAPGFSPKNFITSGSIADEILIIFCFHDTPIFPHPLAQRKSKYFFDGQAFRAYPVQIFLPA